MMTLGVFILGFSSIFTGLNFIVTIHKLRAPGMTWFRMPLFCLGHLRHGDHPGPGDAGARHHAAAADRGARVRRRHLRSAARRRPGALPALLLVLLAPGRLHHDPAGHGHHQRGDPGASRRKTIFGYKAIAYLERRHRAGRLPGLGPPHVRQRAVASWRPRSSRS